MKLLFNRESKSWNGFTLIELVVVLAIIGILIGIAIIGLRASQANARDTARKSFAQQMNAQLLIWAQQNSAYPTAANFYANGGFIDSSISCNSNGNSTSIAVNSRCIGTSGLIVNPTITTTGWCNPTSGLVTSTSINICYLPPIGSSNNYTLAVFLESGSAYVVSDSVQGGVLSNPIVRASL